MMAGLVEEESFRQHDGHRVIVLGRLCIHYRPTLVTMLMACNWLHLLMAADVRASALNRNGSI